MNEKKLYHAALGRTLLDGENVKKSVKSRLKAEGILTEEEKPSRRTKQTQRSIPRAALAAAAAALVLTLAVGATVGILALRGARQIQAADPVGTVPPATGKTQTASSDQEQIPQTMPVPMPMPLNAPAVSLTEGRETYTIRLVPELENPEQYWTYRTFSEEKWGWLRDIRVSTDTVFYENNSLEWHVRFRTDHLKAFRNPFTIGQSGTEQCVDIWLDDLKYVTDGDPIDAGYALDCFPDLADDTSEETCFTLGGVLQLNALKEAFPTEGTVTLIETYRVIDYNVDMQANIATLALIEHRITFDAEEVFSGEDYFPPARHVEADGSSTTVLLLNDIPSDRLTPKMKERIKTFSANEWAWLTNTKLALEGVFYNGTVLSWTDLVATDHTESFAAPEDPSDTKQRVLVKADSLALVGPHNSVAFVADGQSGDFSQSGHPLIHSSESTYFTNGLLATSLWQDEELTATARYWLLDRSLGEDPETAVIGAIEHTFSLKTADLFKAYGTPATEITGIGVKTPVGKMTLELDELHVSDGTLTAVLKLVGADWASFPANLAFRTSGRPEIGGSVSSGWEKTAEGLKSVSVTFPLGANPLWPGNELIISGSLEGDAFSFSYACGSDGFTPGYGNG